MATQYTEIILDDNSHRIFAVWDGYFYNHEKKTLQVQIGCFIYLFKGVSRCSSSPFVFLAQSYETHRAPRLAP